MSPRWPLPPRPTPPTSSSSSSAIAAAPSLQAFVTERRGCRSPSAHSASRPALVAGHQMTSSPSLRRSQVSSFQQPPVPLPWSAAGHAGRGDICLSEDKGIGCLTFRLSPPTPTPPRTTGPRGSLLRYSEGSDLICGIVSCQAGGDNRLGGGADARERVWHVLLRTTETFCERFMTGGKQTRQRHKSLNPQESLRMQETMKPELSSLAHIMLGLLSFLIPDHWTTVVSHLFAMERKVREL